MRLGDGIFEYKKYYAHSFITAKLLKITYMQLNGLVLIMLAKVALERNYKEGGDSIINQTTISLVKTSRHE